MGLFFTIAYTDIRPKNNTFYENCINILLTMFGVGDEI
jgi:hypothetical protein